MNYEGSPIKVTLATLKMSVQPTVRALTLGVGGQGVINCVGVDVIWVTAGRWDSAWFL